MTRVKFWTTNFASCVQSCTDRDQTIYVTHCNVVELPFQVRSQKRLDLPLNGLDDAALHVQVACTLEASVLGS